MNITGIIAIVTAILTVIGLLIRITFNTGQLVARLDDHMEQSARLHADAENRLRALERRTAGRRPL